MSVSFARAIEGLRRPEYTGENRCVPCTVLNLVIAGVASVAVWWGLTWAAVSTFTATLLSVLVLLGCGLTIYLRGYLVPGTPWLTRQYFPDWFLRRFDKGPGGIGDEELDVEAFLKRAGAVEECETEDDLCLTQTFREAWRTRLERLRQDDTSRDDLGSILSVDPERLAFEDHGEAFVARLDDGLRVGQWESQAAFLADVAAAMELSEGHSHWKHVDIKERGGLLNGLRVFLDACPSCEGAVTFESDVVQSCCRSVDIVALTCQNCGARLFEAEQST